MLDGLHRWVLKTAIRGEGHNEPGGVTEFWNNIGPIETALHINGVGPTSVLRIFGRDIVAWTATATSIACWTPLVYYGWDLHMGRILRLFGRTVWSSPTQEE